MAHETRHWLTSARQRHGGRRFLKAVYVNAKSLATSKLKWCRGFMCAPLPACARTHTLTYPVVLAPHRSHMMHRRRHPTKSSAHRPTTHRTSHAIMKTPPTGPNSGRRHTDTNTATRPPSDRPSEPPPVHHKDPSVRPAAGPPEPPSRAPDWVVGYRRGSGAGEEGPVGYRVSRRTTGCWACRVPLGIGPHVAQIPDSSSRSGVHAFFT